MSARNLGACSSVASAAPKFGGTVGGIPQPPAPTKEDGDEDITARVPGPGWGFLGYRLLGPWTSASRPRRPDLARAGEESNGRRRGRGEEKQLGGRYRHPGFRRAVGHPPASGQRPMG